MSIHRPEFEFYFEQRPFITGPLAYDYGDAFKYCYQHNNFYHALVAFGVQATQSLSRYHIGTVKAPGGGSICLLTKSDNPFDGFCDGVIDLFHPRSGRSMRNHVEYVSDRLLENFNIDILNKADRKVFIGESLAHSDRGKPILISRPLISAILLHHFMPEYNSVAIGEHRELLFRDASLLKRLPSETICFLSDDLDAPGWISTIHFLLSVDVGKMLTHVHFEGDLTQAISTNQELIRQRIESKTE